MSKRRFPHGNSQTSIVYEEETTGGRYGPGADSWASTSTTNTSDARAEHTAVWTDSEMFVWGGNPWFNQLLRLRRKILRGCTYSYTYTHADSDANSYSNGNTDHSCHAYCNADANANRYTHWDTDSHT